MRKRAMKYLVTIQNQLTANKRFKYRIQMTAKIPTQISFTDIWLI